MEKHVYSFLDALFRMAEYVADRFPYSADKPQPKVHMQTIRFSPVDCTMEFG